MQREEKVERKNNGKWYFLVGVILLLLVILVIDATKISPILKVFNKLIVQILPVLLLVYFVMLLTNYFVDNKKLKKDMSEDTGFKGLAIAIIAGIISVGPIYIWYPLMQDLQSKGVSNKYLAIFLYNRGIKIQWLPMLILYFGLSYSITLMFMMALVSIPQGILTEKLIELKN